MESAEGFLELLQVIAGVTTPFLALAVVGSLVLRCSPLAVAALFQPRQHREA